MSYVSDLDTPLLKLTKTDNFTLRDACAGVHIWGGIGSGKTSGSGKALASSYLRAGMGGLVLTAKNEEIDLWRSYAAENGRRDSILIFDEKHGFNFITYCIARHGLDGIGTVTETLMCILEAADRAAGPDQGTQEAFWTQAIRQLLNYTIPALYSAYGAVTIPDIINFVTSAADDPAKYADPKFTSTNFAGRTLYLMSDSPTVPLEDHVVTMIDAYWCRQFPGIPSRTRGNIIISMTAKLDRFNHGRLRKMFCADTTIVPEFSFHGIVIVMGMPALVAGPDGIIAQQLFKYMWQNAVESRNSLARAHSDRPVFLWADEAQYFVNQKDDEFLSTCRGSKACVVYLTQTLPTYYARMGRDKQAAADGLVGKFNTQVFHQNACNETNRYASTMIGRGIHHDENRGYNWGSSTNQGMNAGQNTSQGTSWSFGSSSSSGPGGGSSGSTSSSGGNQGSGSNWGNNAGRGSSEGGSINYNTRVDNIIEPNFFATSLRNGGPRHGNKVSAVWFRAGANFRDGHGHFLVPTFQQ